MEIVKLGDIKCIGISQDRIDGLVLKRNVTVDEAKHILSVILGIDILTEDDFGEEEEYQEQSQNYAKVVNGWLMGELDDTAIMELAYDCSDEPIGVFNLIAILAYLKENDIID